LGSERVLGTFDDMSTGSTWSWLPMSCAAAIAMLDELSRPGVLDHVLAIEERSRSAFGALAGSFDAIGDVRSVGALTAIEYVRDRVGKERDTALQDAVAANAFARGLLADSSTTSFNVQPSLITPLEVIDQAAEIVADATATALTEFRGGPRDPRGLHPQARDVRDRHDLRRHHAELLHVPRPAGHRRDQSREGPERQHSAEAAAQARIRLGLAGLEAVHRLPRPALPRQSRHLIREPAAGRVEPEV